MTPLPQARAYLDDEARISGGARGLLRPGANGEAGGERRAQAPSGAAALHGRGGEGGRVGGE